MAQRSKQAREGSVIPIVIDCPPPICRRSDGENDEARESDNRNWPSPHDGEVYISRGLLGTDEQKTGDTRGR
jgi:hypothetical protein